MWREKFGGGSREPRVKKPQKSIRVRRRKGLRLGSKEGPSEKEVSFHPIQNEDASKERRSAQKIEKSQRKKNKDCVMQGEGVIKKPTEVIKEVKTQKREVSVKSKNETAKH